VTAMPTRRLDHMTRDDLRAHADDVLVLPLGSTEQHGPHLAMGTDTLMAARVAEAACERVGDRLGVVLAPSLPYGISEHHLFAGAASLRPETYLRVVNDLLRSLSESGFSRFFVVNGHGGNHDSLGVVSKSAPLDLGVDVAVCSYWNTVAGHMSDLLGEDPVLPGHAGTFETSLVAALEPAMVDLALAPRSQAETPPVWSRPVHPGVDVQLHEEWPRVDGYSDASARATAELGERLFGRITAEVATAVEAFVEVTDQRRKERPTS
jgi:creatinine amidohydrolase